MKLKKITRVELTILSTYMTDDLREYCHTNFTIDDPTDWINNYLLLAEKRDPGFLKLIKSEFDHLIQD